MTSPETWGDPISRCGNGASVLNRVIILGLIEDSAKLKSWASQRRQRRLARGEQRGGAIRVMEKLKKCHILRVRMFQWNSPEDLMCSAQTGNPGEEATGCPFGHVPGLQPCRITIKKPPATCAQKGQCPEMRWSSKQRTVGLPELWTQCS